MPPKKLIVDLPKYYTFENVTLMFPNKRLREVKRRKETAKIYQFGPKV